ncbi:MAG: hypothetical protein JRC92_07695, partial [Deltaproteobacteria bacterium]|nr:hypothetical protein [Deltaproteobacteria bacterium]
MIETQDQQNFPELWQEWARQKLKYLPQAATLVAALVTQQWWAIPVILSGAAGEKLRDWLMGRFIPQAESDPKKLEAEFKALLKDPEIKKAWGGFKAWQKKQGLTDEEILGRLARQEEQLQEVVDSLELLKFKPITNQAQLFASTALKGFRPADLVRRPEVGPLAEALISGPTSALLLHGPALCGKRFLAYKIAQEWLISGRAVVVISYPPDPEAWRRLPSDSLVVADPDQPEPWSSDVIRTALDDCPARLVFCFRTGDARYRDWEEKNWSRIQGLFDDWRPEGANPAKWARLRLGVVPEEVLDEIISANLDQVAGPQGMTLTKGGRVALREILRAGPVDEPTSLLGLSRAFFMAAAKNKLDR